MGRTPGTISARDAVPPNPQPKLLRLGSSMAPVLVVDGFSGGRTEAIVQMASALAPFPPARNAYPGLRRVLTKIDGKAYDYVRGSLQALSPLIARVFGANRFDLLEASFSMVTTPPERLTPPQRQPHFDSTDPDYLAVLHYLSGVANSGTAYYRQRSTGIEMVHSDSVGRFIAVSQEQTNRLGGYVGAGNETFEEIGRVDAVADRLIVYQGCLLHSGIIPTDMAFSPDPGHGRLTGNFFVKTVPNSPLGP